MNLNPLYYNGVDNDRAINWCVATSVYGDGDHGTPGSANDPCPTVTWDAGVSPILQNNCTGCHVGGAISGGKGFEVYGPMLDASNGVPSMPLVTPGDTAASFLLHKLNGTQSSVGGGGSRMPLIGAPMDQYLIDVGERWIEDGAGQN
jgi:hypothetical protein